MSIHSKQKQNIYWGHRAAHFSGLGTEMPGGGGPGEIAGAGDSTAAPHPQNEPADQLCYV